MTTNNAEIRLNKGQHKLLLIKAIDSFEQTMSHTNDNKIKELTKKITSIIHKNTRNNDLHEINSEVCQKAIIDFLKTESENSWRSKNISKQTLSEFLETKWELPGGETENIQKEFIRGGLDAVKTFLSNCDNNYFLKIKENILEYMNACE